MSIVEFLLRQTFHTQRALTYVSRKKESTLPKTKYTYIQRESSHTIEGKPHYAYRVRLLESNDVEVKDTAQA